MHSNRTQRERGPKRALPMMADHADPLTGPNLNLVPAFFDLVHGDVQRTRHVHEIKLILGSAIQQDERAGLITQQPRRITRSDFILRFEGIPRRQTRLF